VSYVWAGYIVTLVVLLAYAARVVLRGRALARAVAPERDDQP
jgi:heme exporter protein CcmD